MNIIYLHIYGRIIDPHNNQLLVGLLVQLAKHCTGITETRVRIPVQTWIFQAFLAAVAIKCDDQIHSIDIVFVEETDHFTVVSHHALVWKM